MNRRGKFSGTIPIDLILEIFSRLPVKSVGRFRCLSKLFGSMLSGPYFTELFLTRSSTRPSLFFALGFERDGEWSFFSSRQLHNASGKSPLVVFARFHLRFSRYMWPKFCGLTSGLIYFSSIRISNSDMEGDVPVIINPRTRQYVSLPKPGKYSRNFILGFDPIDKQFKVLFVAYFADEYRILTLGTGRMKWRKINCPLTHVPSGAPLSREICINGVLYYLATIDDKIPYVIVCFDVRSEKFRFVHAECYDKLINYKGKLGGMKLKYDGDGNTLELHMWVLEDVEKLEWSKYTFYTLWDDKIVNPLGVYVAGVTTMGDIVLSMNYTSRKSRPFYVFYFNPERNTLQKVQIQGLGGYYDENRHRVYAFVDHVDDLYVNDAKYFKSSQDLNIIRERQKLSKRKSLTLKLSKRQKKLQFS